MPTFRRKQKILQSKVFHNIQTSELSSFSFLKNRKNVLCRANANNEDFFFQKRSGGNGNSNENFAQGSRSQKQTSSGRKNTGVSETVSITYEEIGLFPRSFNRVFDRFFKQLFFDVDNLVIQEYRFYRYLFFTTVKCLFLLFFLPLGINFLSKNYFIRPITEYYWNTQNHEIFLNSYQQKQAFTELKNFEEKIYFESLIVSEKQFFLGNDEERMISTSKFSEFVPQKEELHFEQKVSLESPNFSMVFSSSLQKRVQAKILELANHYNEKSIEAVTNFFADVLSFSTLCFLFYRLEIQINITKSFLLEVFFGLDDSKKSLLILFVTDLLVGYHSPNIWELFFQTIFDHYGLPESQTTIFLLVATLPVLLDVLFKYLIFRHLNRASPATVATYHAMIE